MLNMPDIPGNDRCCLSCNRILHGRTDKKFCNDHCRNMHHNRLNGGSNHYMRHIDTQLRRNRRVLQNLLGFKPYTLTSTYNLRSKGFVFHYCTHIHTSHKGKLYHFCYEYGYHVLENEQVRIVQKKK